uniref:Uncharacterized protein n=1 Tax=Anguilla anguilla TaxID=7936 RepID=A0A0E9V788_ANGAN
MWICLVKCFPATLSLRARCSEYTALVSVPYWNECFCLFHCPTLIAL